jgi:hypothetical protein
MVIEPIHRWECPSCGLTDVTNRPDPHSRMHACGAQKGLTVPMVEVDRELKRNEVRHVALEREDYEGAERVTKDNEGRPIMAVHTERADGSHDCTVYAPVATVEVG